MAYHGYIPLVKNYLDQFETPTVLEVGLDRGITSIPVVTHLARKHEAFVFFGIDVLLQESLKITLSYIDYAEKQSVRLCQGNSLDVLPKLVAQKAKFDVLLIDGDHNYYTVAKELEYLDDLTHENSLVIIDDYHGRWGDKDLWYSDRKEYEAVAEATKPQETEKHGVRPAVDEFVEKIGKWKLETPIKGGEPVVLTRVRGA
jgi:predicted O-methyltransferase YrrM